jgi:hypothetical protein
VLVGMRDPRRQRWAALTMAMLMRLLASTHPQTPWEQGFSHFSASKQGGKFLQQSFGFFAEGTHVRRDSCAKVLSYQRLH